MDKKCLNCTFFRLDDIYSGRCRVDKSELGGDRLPLVRKEDSCSRWIDCGQQYYIRLGWIKSTKKKMEGPTEKTV
jgi:hypothetical protein